MKEFADDNLKFYKNGRKLSKQVENTVGKEEIARYEQFLLFPQCFQKACFPEVSKGVIVWEWVKHLSAVIYVILIKGNHSFGITCFIPSFGTIANCQKPTYPTHKLL